MACLGHSIVCCDDNFKCCTGSFRGGARVHEVLPARSWLGREGWKLLLMHSRQLCWLHMKPERNWISKIWPAFLGWKVLWEWGWLLLDPGVLPLGLWGAIPSSREGGGCQPPFPTPPTHGCCSPEGRCCPHPYTAQSPCVMSSWGSPRWFPVPLASSCKKGCWGAGRGPRVVKLRPEDRERWKSPEGFPSASARVSLEDTTFLPRTLYALRGLLDQKKSSTPRGIDWNSYGELLWSQFWGEAPVSYSSLGYRIPFDRILEPQCGLPHGASSCCSLIF